MDTSVRDITFEPDGQCSYCRAALERIARESYVGERHRTRLDGLVSAVRTSGCRKPYDCIIGVSGGLDSSYVAYVVKKRLALRPLAVHFDNGWNSELAVENIELLLKKLDIDLQTCVVDWDEFRDLQLAFLKSGVANTEIPTDHAILALLYRTAAEQGIRYILHGGNLATESIMPAAWMEDAKDLRLIRSIARRFGTMPLKTFPSMSLSRLAYYTFVRRIRYVGILNYVDYTRANAMRTVEAELGWRPYGSKHFESIFTRFFQAYVLPRRLGYDKRRPHLSSLIVSGQITRDDALRQLAGEPMDSTRVAEDMAYVRQKFRLTEAEFDAIMRLPPKSSADYPSSDRLFKAVAPLVRQAKAVASVRTKGAA
jgi:N-acetyl sugar amidotransferase